jgi:hypothetical protein
MALNGTVVPAAAGTHGFDTDTVLTERTAAGLRAVGFAFAIRYLARGRGEAPGDLSPAEAERILGAGLALMPVQHVPPVGWLPTEALGAADGADAAFNAQRVGFPAGVNVWLDLEGIHNGAAPADVIAFCNAWFDAVNGAGYVGGVYVGANAILSGDQLFFRLKTKHYWRRQRRAGHSPSRLSDGPAHRRERRRGGRRHRPQRGAERHVRRRGADAEAVNARAL